MEEKTKIDVAKELYNKGYDVNFISEFIGSDVMTIKSWVMEDDPKKTLKNPVLVPDKKPSLVETEIRIPVLKTLIAKDMPSVIKGLTLVGYDIPEIAKAVGVSEDTLLRAIDDIDELAQAYNYAKRDVHIEVVKNLFDAMMPRELVERRYRITKDSEGKEVRVLEKEVVKQYAGNVDAMFKWMEAHFPEKWNNKQNALKELLAECGVALSPADVEEAEWTAMAEKQQETLGDVLEDEKRRITEEYVEDDLAKSKVD